MNQHRRLVFLSLACLALPWQAPWSSASPLRADERPSPSSLDQPALEQPASLLALAETIPLLNVNLNNYKYHGNPILSEGNEGDWDERGIDRVVVLRTGRDEWRMWYSAHDAKRREAIGLATSTDGIRWTKFKTNPVLEPAEEWEGQRISPTSVVYADGSFFLYYWGPGHVKPTPIKRIGLAVSKDGIQWTKKGAVLDAEPRILNEDPKSGGSGVDAAKVFYVQEENKWYMIFTGFGRYGQWNGLAESPDGIRWTKTKAPLTVASGLHNRLEANVLPRVGQTLRCPVKVGSAWVALDYHPQSGDCYPAIAGSLDRWLTLGRPILHANQEYEGARVPPVSLESIGDHYFIYYMMYGLGDSPRVNRVGLIRAPRRSTRQPMVLWDQEEVAAEGRQSMILEPDRPRITAYVLSDQAGVLQLLINKPERNSWHELESVEMQQNKLCVLPMSPAPAKVRLKFTPAHGTARVSAWAIQE